MIPAYIRTMQARIVDPRITFPWEFEDLIARDVLVSLRVQRLESATLMKIIPSFLAVGYSSAGTEFPPFVNQKIPMKFVSAEKSEPFGLCPTLNS